MYKDVETCLTTDPLTEAARIMWDRDCGCVPVVADKESRRVVGIVTDRDALMAVYTRGRPLAELRVGDVMSPRVKTCSTNDALSDVKALMASAQVRRLPVVDTDGCLLGMLSLADLAHEFGRQKGSRRSDVSASDVSELLAGVCAPHSPLVATS